MNRAEKRELSRTHRRVDELFSENDKLRVWLMEARAEGGVLRGAVSQTARLERQVSHLTEMMHSLDVGHVCTCAHKRTGHQGGRDACQTCVCTRYIHKGTP